jgi:two-component system chemotaxis response regulator CheB
VAHSRIVVIGASAGGFEAVSTVLDSLPEDLPASVLVVIHTGPGGILANAFRHRSALPVALAEDGQPLAERRVYMPPADRHLTVQDGVVRVVKGPREHGFRPAVDPLFVTAARAAGDRVAGVILSGALSDGTLGLNAVKQAGGFTIVQHPGEAAVASMPLSALRNVAVDAVLPVAQIGRELTEWAMHGARRHAEKPRSGNGQPAEPRRDNEARELMAFTCPSCGGAISETQEAGITAYECHVGHRFDAESMVALGDERTEDTLWQAMRALQERALLRRRMHSRAQERGLKRLAGTWLEEATDSEKRADEIRRLIESMPTAAAEQLIEAGTSPASGNGRRRRRGSGAAAGEDTPTREQARTSSEMHEASLEKTGHAATSTRRASAKTRRVRNGRSRRNRRS